jgi:hypothetical protein
LVFWRHHLLNGRVCQRSSLKWVRPRIDRIEPKRGAIGDENGARDEGLGLGWQTRERSNASFGRVTLSANRVTEPGD